MYYSKDLKESGEPEMPSFFELQKAINYLPFVLNAHQASLLDLFDPKTRPVLLDSAAAMVEQLCYRGFLKTDDLMHTVSVFFHNFIQTRGYKLIPDVGHIEHSQAEMTFLVVGCQTNALLDSRVEAAWKAVKELGKRHVTVVFSGANPTRARAVAEPTVKSGRAPHVVDEAAEMHATFRRLHQLDPDPPPGLTFVCKEESASTRTAENISFFFRERDLSTKARNHVIVVSSLFHLPRLTRELEEHIKKNDVPVRRLTLVGSEDPHRGSDPARSHYRYVKSALYEALALMFEHVNHEALFKPPST